METTVLKNVQPRDQFGTRASHALRLEGGIPANVIGDGKPNRLIRLDKHEFDAAIRHGFRSFHLENVDEGDVVVLQEVQWDSMGDIIQHIDFRRDPDGSVGKAQEKAAKAQEEAHAQMLAKAAADAQAAADAAIAAQEAAELEEDAAADADGEGSTEGEAE